MVVDKVVDFIMQWMEDVDKEISEQVRTPPRSL
jgi:hypothetical protein